MISLLKFLCSSPNTFFKRLNAVWVSIYSLSLQGLLWYGLIRFLSCLLSWIECRWRWNWGHHIFFASTWFFDACFLFRTFYQIGLIINVLRSHFILNSNYLLPFLKRFFLLIWKSTSKWEISPIEYATYLTTVNICQILWLFLGLNTDLK